MNRHSRNRSRESGFSLVELMIAVVLGLILTAGVISVYISSKKTYALNNAVGQVQESGRFALGFLEKPIRMAGFYGCARDISPNSLLKDTTSQAYNTSDSIQGYEFTGGTGTGIGKAYTLTTITPSADNTASDWSPSLPADISLMLPTSGTGAPIAGSDMIILHEALAGGINLVSPYTDNSAGIFVSNTGPLSINELAVVTDCSHSDLFQITNISTSSGRVDHSANGTMTPGDASAAKLSFSYGAGAQVLLYETYMLYIGIGTDKTPSLFEMPMGSAGLWSTPQEMVPGVESMQILYGEDTDTIPDQIPNKYETADQVGSFANVVSVRVALLVGSDDASIETTPTTAQTYTLLGNTSSDTSNGVTLTVPKDRRLRRVFSETISIRNRLP